MIAVILSAGIGSRLKPMTAYYPKSLLNINDKTILENMIFKLLHEGIIRILVVVGYKQDVMLKFIEKMNEKYSSSITAIYNPLYNQTNTSYSLFLALNQIDEDDVIIINGDLIFEQALLKKTVHHSNTVLVIENSKFDQESMKIKFLNESSLDIGKSISLTETKGEFIGLSLIKVKDLKLFKSILNGIISDNPKEYYDIAFKALSKLSKIDVTITDGLKWVEIDYPEDLKKAKQLFK
jgi:choline kinase